MADGTQNDRIWHEDGRSGLFAKCSQDFGFLGGFDKNSGSGQATMEQWNGFVVTQALHVNLKHFSIQLFPS